ncbi:MAG TPA: DUF4388 domain-containing protein [Chitinivibrionales bacterium]|nr:DUF4388 domain-containing protein [Chitinivibrionales bacterium]
MALRGSLREFELAEIFQLISRDAKTGQLILSHEGREAFVIFSQGAVVAAGNSDQNLQTLLSRYLKAVKRYSDDEVNELLTVCQGEMRLFSQELINRKYMTQEELVAFAQMGIEDLACSLFLWEDGNYRFDTLESIHEYIVAGVTFPVDAITMEAMRRTDEWKRIRQHIKPDTVFTPAQKVAPSAALAPLADPSAYILSFVNGTAKVSLICEKSIFLPYRVYETLFGLWQNSSIAPLAVKRAHAKAPGLEPVRKPAAEFAAATVSLIAILGWLLAIFAFSYIENAVLLRKAVAERQQAMADLPASQASQKIRIAALQYHTLQGSPPPKIKTLVSEGLITERDLYSHKTARLPSTPNK